MFTKTTMALALILASATGALAATKQHSSNPSFDVYNGRGVYVGSDPDPRVRLELQRDGGWRE